MPTAYATMSDHTDRIIVRTRASNGEFHEVLAACKAVGGGRFKQDETGKYWHYPLTVDTCKALRRAFGDWLEVGEDLATWYRAADREASVQTTLSGRLDATLEHVPPHFAEWLRGYQRAGAAWMARTHRGAGLVGDQPGLGKTAQTIAALMEAGVTGPVLVVCPKASVRLVWGAELAQHAPDVPRYLCAGRRDKREKEIARLRADIAEDPNRLRVVVVVAEMLRVKMGPPCIQKETGNRVSGMCKRGPAHDRNHVEAEVDKKKFVPVGYQFPELFDRDLLAGGWSSVILDESHKLLGSLNVVKANLMGRGLKALPERDRRRYAISGSPFGKGGRAQGLFGTLHWLWPDEFSSFWKWARDLFVIEEQVVNRRGKTIQKIIRLKGLRPDATPEEEAKAWEDFMSALGPRILRRTKAEVLSQLPPKAVYEVACEKADLQARQFEELVEWAEIKTPYGIIAANGSLALLTREKQLANAALEKGVGDAVHFDGRYSGKLDQLWEKLDARGILDGFAGPKLIIASAFNEFLDEVARLLEEDGVEFLQYDGRVPQLEREKIVRWWQSGKGTERVMLFNSAAGVSITLDAADEMHIMDEHPDPGQNEQLEDRIHRASNVDHKVSIFYYRTEGTIDYRRAHDTEYRRRVQHAMMDGRRGVAYVRELLREAGQAEEAA